MFGIDWLIDCLVFWSEPEQVLREEVDRNRAEVAQRDGQWRSSSRQLNEQLTALREDNEDLRFQVPISNISTSCVRYAQYHVIFMLCYVVLVLP